MYRKIVFVTLVVLLAATVASAGRRGRYGSGIRQSQNTYLGIKGGTYGYGTTTASSGGSVYADQAARSKYGSYGRQTASANIGKVSTWFWGEAYTSQYQRVK